MAYIVLASADEHRLRGNKKYPKPVARPTRRLGWPWAVRGRPFVVTRWGQSHCFAKAYLPNAYCRPLWGWCRPGCIVGAWHSNLGRGKLPPSAELQTAVGRLRFPRTRRLSGWHRYAQCDWPGAIKSYERALEQDAKNAVLLANMSAALLMQGPVAQPYPNVIAKPRSSQ